MVEGLGHVRVRTNVDVRGLRIPAREKLRTCERTVSN